MQKDYLYKVYKGDTYLGLLANVTSEFVFTQDVNSAGSKIAITVKIANDVAALPVGNLLAETGATLQDEASNLDLYEERIADSFGSNNQLAQLRNGNRIDVWEFSDYYVNGRCAFTGIINRLEGEFNGDQTEEVVTAAVHSRGFSLDDFILQDA